MTILEKARKISEPLSVREVRMGDDTVIKLRRHGNPAGPKPVLSRGNGLASCFHFFEQTHGVCRRSVAS
ncbi:MAG: hypothetical protein OXG62_06035 [Nitrospinae bacterium]|nr:hypothetical protein [Nitrospinota bacterium]